MTTKRRKKRRAFLSFPIKDPAPDMDDQTRQEIAARVTDRLPEDVEVSYSPGKGGPGEPVYTVGSYSLRVEGTYVPHVLSRCKKCSEDEIADRVRRALDEQHVRGHAIAEQVTAALKADEQLPTTGMRVEFKHFGHGKGYTFWAGQAGSTPADLAAGYEEVLAGAKKLAAHRGNQFWADPQSKGSTGEPYFAEQG